MRRLKGRHSLAAPFGKTLFVCLNHHLFHPVCLVSHSWFFHLSRTLHESHLVLGIKPDWLFTQDIGLHKGFVVSHKTIPSKELISDLMESFLSEEIDQFPDPVSGCIYLWNSFMYSVGTNSLQQFLGFVAN